MANHLNLQTTLLEMDEQGNMNVISKGKIIRLLSLDLRRMLIWLAMERREPHLVMESIHMEIDERGSLEISKFNQSIVIPCVEVLVMCNWLKHR